MNHELDEAGFVKLGAMAMQLDLKQPVIFDVGGNIGQSVERFDELFTGANIHSFEPHPAAFDELRRKFGGADNVQCVQLALGARKGTVRFHAAYRSEVSSLLPPEPFVMERSVNNNYDHDEIEVAMETMDDYAARHGVDRVDIMKLDVQGAELDVLAGASGLLSRGRVGLLFVEVMFAENYCGQCYFDDVWGVLKTHGYRLWDLYPFLHTSAGRLWTGNALFTSPSMDALLDPR